MNTDKRTLYFRPLTIIIITTISSGDRFYNMLLAVYDTVQSSVITHHIKFVEFWRKKKIFSIKFAELRMSHR